MKTDHIKLEISRHNWAIVPEAFQSILEFVDAGIEMDPELFHKEQQKISAYFGDAVPDTYYSYRRGGVGVLSIDGPIIPRATMFSQISGVASIDVLTDEFLSMEADPKVEEIVLLMDTPGGAVTGISDFADLIAASDKRVTAFAWQANSAGYWIASAADEIIAPLSGMVGSIGVITTYTDSTEADAKRGVKFTDLVSSQSPNKRADISTDTGRAVVQQLLDDLAAGFIETVARNRGVTAEVVETTFGAGAVFAAPRAMDAGMIDGVMDFGSFMAARSSGKQPIFGFTVKGQNMSDESNRIDAAESAEASPPAADQRAEERERIRGIESLLSALDGAHPAVVSAARAEVDRIKYDPDFSKESAAVNVLGVVARAQAGLVGALAESKVEINKAAEAVSAATPPAEPDQKVIDMARASELSGLMKGGK